MEHAADEPEATPCCGSPAQVHVAVHVPFLAPQKVSSPQLRVDAALLLLLPVMVTGASEHGRFSIASGARPPLIVEARPQQCAGLYGKCTGRLRALGSWRAFGVHAPRRAASRSAATYAARREPSTNGGGARADARSMREARSGGCHVLLTAL